MDRELRSVKRVLILVVIVVVYPIGIASQQPATVSLTVTITEKSGRYVSGLSKDQVTLLDEEIPQEITAFEKVNVPVSVGFLFEMSALRRAEFDKAARSALLRFIAASNPANEYFIAGIDGDSYSARPFSRDVTSIGSVFDSIAKASLTSKSTHFEALNFGIDKVQSGANRKHVIVFVANNDGNPLKRRMPELLESVKQHDVILYVIKLRDLIGSNLKSSAFDELTSTSGGKSFYPTTENELNDIFDILALELAHQYSLVFKPANPTKAASQWHRLQVSVKPLQIKESGSGKITPVPLFARSRSGYYEQGYQK